MYINKEELLNIIDKQIERSLDHLNNTIPTNDNYIKEGIDSLNYVKEKLNDNKKIQIDLIIHILNKESDLYGMMIRNKARKGENPYFFQHKAEKISFTLEELYKIKMKTEYKGMVE